MDLQDHNASASESESRVSPGASGIDASDPRALDDAHRAPCHLCGYDMRGLESRVCPECGQTQPTFEAAFTTDVAGAVAGRGLRCRHCKRPLDQLVDGVCACGATYQVLKGTPRSPRGKSNGAMFDGPFLLATLTSTLLGMLTVIPGMQNPNTQLALGSYVVPFVPMAFLVVWILARPALDRLPIESLRVIQVLVMVLTALCVAFALGRLG